MNHTEQYETLEEFARWMVSHGYNPNTDKSKLYTYQCWIDWIEGDPKRKTTSFNKMIFLAYAKKQLVGESNEKQEDCR